MCCGCMRRTGLQGHHSKVELGGFIACGGARAGARLLEVKGHWNWNNQNANVTVGAVGPRLCGALHAACYVLSAVCGVLLSCCIASFCVPVQCFVTA